MNFPNIKIVADSSSNMISLSDVPFASAPLKIITANAEYIDDKALNVEQMVDDLSNYRGKSSTACPSPGDWLDAFGDAQYVFCISITSGLSGSYNAACIAKKTYEDHFPNRKVFVIDSLSTGPEIRLIVEKLREYILSGKAFDDICTAISEYTNGTALLFMLESMRNLANNGRVNHLVAKAAGLLGIRIVGKASDKGELEILEKSRGEKRALHAIVQNMKHMGHNGGKVRIDHCCNESAAIKLKELILEEFKTSQIEIFKSGGLCSYYAEKGGLMIGFEK